jgi:hypothetical protein
MSQLILDDQLSARQVLAPIRHWITAQFLRELRPNERIPDARVPEILRTLRQPTFITIDQGFWNRRWCHLQYAILYFALREDEQELLPGLLRALLRRPEFRTRASRMGKVARVGTTSLAWWQFQSPDLLQVAWPGTPRRRRGR